MTETTLHAAAVWTEIGLAGAALLALLFVDAPYGRHTRPGWGPTMPARLGWLIMESPAVILFAAVYAVGDRAWQAAPLALAGLWMVHYVHRTLVFPFLWA